MKKGYSNNIHLLLVFLSGGLLCFIFLNITNIQFDSKLNLSDILNILITSLIGIYLGVIIQKQHSSTRFEKEYLISEIKKIIEEISCASVFKNFNDIDFSEAKSKFKEINIDLTNFENTIQESSFFTTHSNSKVRTCFSEFRKSITNLKHNSINKRITPSYTEMTNIHKAYKALRRELFKEIISING